MGTLNLTTADNPLTIIVNGVTIKQMYAKHGDENPVKIYQKWKNKHVQQYTNTKGSLFLASMNSSFQKYWSSSRGNSRCEYYFSCSSGTSSYVGLGRANACFYESGILRWTSNYYTSGNGWNSFSHTVRSSETLSYDRQNYEYYIILYTSSGSSSSTSYGSDSANYSSHAYTPSYTGTSSTTLNGTTVSVSANGYQGVDTSYNTREEDN